MKIASGRVGGGGRPAITASCWTETGHDPFLFRCGIRAPDGHNRGEAAGIGERRRVCQRHIADNGSRPPTRLAQRLALKRLCGRAVGKSDRARD